MTGSQLALGANSISQALGHVTGSQLALGANSISQALGHVTGSQLDLGARHSVDTDVQRKVDRPFLPWRQSQC